MRNTRLTHRSKNRLSASAFPNRPAHLPNRILSSFPAAFSCIPGITCPYRSSVNDTLVWPSRSLTTLGFSPAARRSVAQVCRQSYHRNRSGSPSCLRIGFKVRRDRLSPFGGPPFGLAKTRSRSSYVPRKRRRCSACFMPAKDLPKARTDSVG